MKKKITLILTTILLLTNVVGCGTNTVTNENIVTPAPTAIPTLEPTKAPSNTYDEESNNTTSTIESEYYPFVKNNGNYLYLTVTPQEFIENYNKAIIGKGYDGKTWDISLSDFEFIKSASCYGRQTSFYICPLTIFGRNDGIIITMEVYDDDNTIAALQLGIKNYHVYDSDANEDTIDGFYAQYAYLMSGLGLSSDEAVNILYNLSYNESQYKNYSLYKKGLAFGFVKNGNSTGWYRIFPLTKDMAEENGYGDVISK